MKMNRPFFNHTFSLYKQLLEFNAVGNGIGIMSRLQKYLHFNAHCKKHGTMK